MEPHSDPIILSALAAATLLELTVFIIWCVALAQIRRGFLWVLVFCSLLIVVFVSFDTLLAYDARILTRMFSSREAFKTAYYIYVWAQPINIFIFLIGQIMLVSWMIRASRRERPSTSGLFSRRI